MYSRERSCCTVALATWFGIVAAGCRSAGLEGEDVNFWRTDGAGRAIVSRELGFVSPGTPTMMSGF